MRSFNKIKKKCKSILRVEFITLSLVIFTKIIYFLCLEVNCTADSHEYIARNGFDLFAGELDRFRLPVYPILIDIFTYLFGDNSLSALCYFQLILALVSIILLYVTIKNLTKNQWISLGITTFYGLSNTVIGWEKAILTESLSLSLTIIIAWGVILYLKKNSKKAIVVAVIATTIGCFLRAVFAIYVALIFGFLILRLIFPGKNLGKLEIKMQRIRDLKCSAIAIVPVILLLLYASAFSHQYGAFTLSDSGLGQQVAIVLSKGYYLNSQDEEIKKVAEQFLNSTSGETVTIEIKKSIDNVYKNSSLTNEGKEELAKTMFEYYDKDKILDPSCEQELNSYFSNLYQSDYTCDDAGSIYMARCYIMNNFSRERVDSFVSECIKSNFKVYVLDMFYIYEEFASYQIPLSNSIAKALKSFLDSTILFLHITLIQGMIVGFVELALFVIVLIRKKLADWIHLGLAGFILSTGFLAIIGTNAEFARTAITMVPFIFISIGLWINLLYTKFICKNKD